MGNGTHDCPVIDWLEFQVRLQLAKTNLERTLQPDENTVTSILQYRAQILARTSASEDVAHTDLELIEFRLAHEHYAFETRHVNAVHTLRQLTPLPGTPAFMRGIIYARGRIVAVIDLREFFGLPQHDLTDLNKVLILGDSTRELGVLADSIVAVKRLPLKKMQAPLSLLSDRRAAYLMGVSQDRTVVLDAEKILIDESLVIDDR